jgi:hypothetical protein
VLHCNVKLSSAKKDIKIRSTTGELVLYKRVTKYSRKEESCEVHEGRHVNI